MVIIKRLKIREIDQSVADKSTYTIVKYLCTGMTNKATDWNSKDKHTDWDKVGNNLKELDYNANIGNRIAFINV